MLWRLAAVLSVVAIALGGAQEDELRNGDQLVSSVLMDCTEMDCVKTKVLTYLDNVLGLKTPAETARGFKNIDAAIFKRAARVLKTHEFRVKLPEIFFGDSEVVYNPRTGLDVVDSETEARGALKKKLLLPVLLLLKLKLKALMPIFLALIGIKAIKALILSKLAILIVIGFVVYQLVTKAGVTMPMAMNAAPAEPPAPMYGPPSTSPPNSYEPSWEPNSGGPYARVWNNNPSPVENSAQNLAYSAYYPGAVTTTTNRP
ncbi:uncharacterized protein LOC108734511 [Agrilus planipennis]|uniref:Uncharacterized protein LOC108734511 n=1 Tax=Agrilus planipennis TaxID=224129 RepID=A0A1W4WC97_AGRPL|nr:uncharacterized protein LOC108734511 [Agrilus planipennis]